MLYFQARCLDLAAVLLAWPKIRGITDRMMRFINLTDYHALGMSHVGMNYLADDPIECFKSYYEAFGKQRI